MSNGKSTLRGTQDCCEFFIHAARFSQQEELFGGQSLINGMAYAYANVVSSLADFDGSWPIKKHEEITIAVAEEILVIVASYIPNAGIERINK